MKAPALQSNAARKNSFLERVRWTGNLALLRRPKGRSERHDLGPLLSQGRNPYCVAAALAALLNHKYANHPSTLFEDKDLTVLQAAIQRHTPSPIDDSPEAGSFVQGAANFAVAQGHFRRTIRLRTLPEIHAWLERKGPVLTSCMWFKGMDTLTDDGIAQVRGGLRGGHAIALFGHDKGDLLFRQSWRGYAPYDAHGQQARITFNHSKRLFRWGMDAFGFER